MQKRFFIVLVCLLLASRAASAQQQSGIAGLVRDASGGVLPGVTVEAASPALIEKVRTAVTDEEGRYNIVDLRPGTYAVTFSLPGFATLRREGIVLTVGFTATVNADLQVGSLEESITVTGAAPLVDTQNIRQQTVVDKENLATLPTATQTAAALTMLVPGMKGSTDVGGSGGTYANSGNNVSYHGKTGRKFSFDGMQIQNLQGAGNTSYMMNQALIEETSVETGGRRGRERQQRDHGERHSAGGRQHLQRRCQRVVFERTHAGRQFHRRAARPGTHQRQHGQTYL